MQFLPASQPLVAKAVREALTRESAGLLQTGRAKDHARLIMFVEAGVADME